MSTRTRLDRLADRMPRPTPEPDLESLRAEAMRKLDDEAAPAVPLTPEEQQANMRAILVASVNRSRDLGEPTDRLERLADEWGVPL